MNDEVEQVDLLEEISIDEVDAFFASSVWAYLDQEAAKLAGAHMHLLSTSDDFKEIHRSQGALSVIRDKRGSEEWIRNRVMEIQKRRQEETTEE